MKNCQRTAARVHIPLLLLGLVIPWFAACSGFPSRSTEGSGASTAPQGTANSNGDSGTELGRISTAPGSANPAANAAPRPATLSPATAAQNSADAQALASQCDSLRADIREAQSNERLAPTTSVDEDIVSAREAKDDQRIADLQQQYDQLGCPSAQLPPAHTQTAQPPAAPGTPLP